MSRQDKPEWRPMPVVIDTVVRDRMTPGHPKPDTTADHVVAMSLPVRILFAMLQILTKRVTTTFDTVIQIGLLAAILIAAIGAIILAAIVAAVVWVFWLPTFILNWVTRSIARRR